MIDIAIMGHGTVGSGVAEVIFQNKDKINQSIKNEINIKYILDLRKFDSLPYKDKFTDDFEKIINDDNIKIVVEVMGGIHPAYEYTKRCLEKGKSVVTSNKELVAEKGAELIDIADKLGVNFLFEASVGGGIPILRPMVQCLAANEITEVKGILNGTTNYILNKMIVDDMDFNSALTSAQEKGYAERNPAADIEGHDACRKICILASLAFGKHIYPEQVKTEGITNITLDDVKYANDLGYAIKLIGKAEKIDDNSISASVRPTLVPYSHLLSNVNGVFNAVSVVGNAVGEVMFYGKGAGKLPTASAVVADIIDCSKHISARKYLYWKDGSPDYVKEVNNKTSLFVSASSKDFEELKRSIKNVFDSCVLSTVDSEKGKISFITPDGFEDELIDKINSIKADSIKIIHTL